MDNWHMETEIKTGSKLKIRTTRQIDTFHADQTTQKLTIWFKFCCDIAPLGGAGGGPGVVPGVAACIDC